MQEPKAWTRKYLIAASDSKLLEPQTTKGTKDKRFTSKPIQI